MKSVAQLFSSSDLKINPRKFESGTTVFKNVDFGLKSSTMVAGSFI
jgi:hypothetical protein